MGPVEVVSARWYRLGRDRQGDVSHSGRQPWRRAKPADRHPGQGNYIEHDPGDDRANDREIAVSSAVPLRLVHHQPDRRPTTKLKVAYFIIGWPEQTPGSPGRTLPLRHYVEDTGGHVKHQAGQGCETGGETGRRCPVRRAPLSRAACPPTSVSDRSRVGDPMPSHRLIFDGEPCLVPPDVDESVRAHGRRMPWETWVVLAFGRWA